MGWFEEQIRERMRQDDEDFTDAIAGMASVIMGNNLHHAMSQDRLITQNAIEEILRYYHIKIQKLPEHICDLDDQLEYLMRPAGVMRRVVLLKEGWYKDLVGAMLASRRDDGTIVALIPRKFGGYQFYDARQGKTVRVNKKTAQLLDDEAMCFYKPLPVGKIGVHDLIIYMMQCVSLQDIWPLLVLAVIATGLSMILPALNNIIYKNVIPTGGVQIFTGVFLFLLCVNLSKVFFDAAQSLASNKIGTKLTLQVEAASMMRILSLPAHFFQHEAAGALSNRFSYMSNICTMLLSLIFGTGLTSFLSFAYIGQMFLYGPGLVIPSVILLILTSAFSVIAGIAQIHLSEKLMNLEADESGMTYAMLSGIQKIRLSGSEKRMFSRWAKHYRQALVYLYNPPLLIKFSGLISTALGLLSSLVMYYFTIKTGVSLPDYFAFTAAFGMVNGAFSALLNSTLDIANLKPMLNMVKPILECETEINSDKKVVSKLSGSIELNNVSFRYHENMPWVLDDLSLKIRPGQYVAIVGKTGCGKSTLIRLLLGFETAQKGAIYYDGKDISNLDLKSLRRNIGTVLQNGKLMQGDIYSNIIITNPQLTEEQAWEAAALSGIDEDIAAMPMGMHTVISEGMGGISGGQRQRLLIARAVAGKPKVLIFDEATSALDNITQKKISDALEALQCTRVVVAHRLSTIRNCDRILVMDKGRIIEDGNYNQLIEQNGYFAQLVAKQQLN